MFLTYIVDLGAFLFSLSLFLHCKRCMLEPGLSHRHLSGFCSFFLLLVVPSFRHAALKDSR